MHFLEGTFKKAIFHHFHMTIQFMAILFRNRALIISCLCNVLFTGLQHDTTFDSLSVLDRMAGETGGGGGPSPPGPSNSIFWVGPGGTQYITKMGPFYFPWTVFQQLQ